MTAERPVRSTARQIIEECSTPIDLRIQEVDDYGPDDNYINNYVPRDAPVIATYNLEFEDQLYEVRPYTIEDWLNDPNRSTEEIDQVLEDWLTIHQEHFSEPKASRLAESYSIRNPLKPATARMMSYTAVADEYVGLIRKNQTQIEQYKQQLADSRLQINEAVRTKQKSKGQGEKERRQLEHKYRSDIAPYDEDIKKYKHVQHHIARKFIREQFSPNASTHDFNLRPDNLKTVIRDIYGLDRSRESFILFLDTVSESMQKPDDQDFADNYTYKQGAGISRNVQDIKSLALALELALDKEPLEERLDQSVANLGESYISFVARQGAAKSKREIQFADSYPLLTTFYDTLNSVMTLSQYHTFKDSLPVLIEKTMGGVLRSGLVQQEAKKLANRYKISAQQIYQQHGALMSGLGNERFENIPQKIKDFTISDQKRLTDGMREGLRIAFSLGSIPGPFSSSPSIKIFHQNVNSAFVQQKEISPLTRELRRDLQSLNNSTIFPILGVSVDFVNSLAATQHTIPHSPEAKALLNNSTYSSPQIEIVRKATENRERPQGTFAQRAQEIQQQMRMLIEKGIFPAEAMRDDSLLREYRLFHISTPYDRPSPEALSQLRDETRELWFQMLNISKWFISPRGDIYQSEDDAELRENEMQSITFEIDRKFPREHKVKLQLEGVQQPVELWLDTHERLLDSEHQPLTVDGTFQLSLTNLLLKRLNFITSGVLAQSQQEHENRGYGGGPNFTYRRAHYHVLRDPRYTMTSRGVEPHAEEIFRIYGIDIFQERERRRFLRVIGEREHITFNGETVPDVMPENPPPNRIIYKPELLEQYMQEHRNRMLG